MKARTASDGCGGDDSCMFMTLGPSISRRIMIPCGERKKYDMPAGLFFCLFVVCYWHCSSLDNCGWFIGWYSRSLFQLKRSGGGPGIPRSAFFLIILKL